MTNQVLTLLCNGDFHTFQSDDDREAIKEHVRLTRSGILETNVAPLFQTQPVSLETGIIHVRHVLLVHGVVSTTTPMFGCKCKPLIEESA